MTKAEKDQIITLRNQGIKYSKIAEQLKISENTIKSYYRRAGFVNDKTGNDKIEINKCVQCDKELIKNQRGKQKKFCCESCRRKWWKKHNTEGKREAFYEITCAACAKKFRSYGNKNRKFCSRGCYISSRFQGGTNDDKCTV